VFAKVRAGLVTPLRPPTEHSEKAVASMRAGLCCRCFRGKLGTQSRVHHISKRNTRSTAQSPGGYRPAALTIWGFCNYMVERRSERYHRAKSVPTFPKSTFTLNSSRASNCLIYSMPRMEL
jgi:hypothetical protein